MTLLAIIKPFVATCPSISRTQNCAGKSRAQDSRAGISLLEVVLAFVILATSMVAIGQLMMLGAKQSTTVIEQAKGQQYALSVLDAVAAGAIPLDSTQDTPLPSDPAWNYSLDVQQNEFSELLTVIATVEVAPDPSSNGVQSRIKPSTVTLTRWVLDPQQVAARVEAAYVLDQQIIQEMIDAEAEAGADDGGGR